MSNQTPLTHQRPLTDAHAHLQADRFDADREEVIARLVAAGVTRLLIPSWSVASSQGAVEVVRSHEWMDAAIGIHPHHAADEASAREELLARAGEPEIVAIGETGIDTKRNFAPWVRSVPADRLLTETDAPWLAMPGAPDSSRNEPTNVALTLAWVAAQRGEEPDALAATISATYDRALPRQRPRSA